MNTKEMKARICFWGITWQTYEQKNDYPNPATGSGFVHNDYLLVAYNANGKQCLKREFSGQALTLLISNSTITFPKSGVAENYEIALNGVTNAKVIIQPVKHNLGNGYSPEGLLISVQTANGTSGTECLLVGEKLDLKSAEYTGNVVVDDSTPATCCIFVYENEAKV